MTVARLSSSGKQLQIVDDDGRIYGCALGMMRGVLDGKIKLLLFSRLPFDIAPDRFAKSPVWSNGQFSNDDGNQVKEFTTTGDDGLSRNRLQKKEDSTMYLDKEVIF